MRLINQRWGLVVLRREADTGLDTSGCRYATSDADGTRLSEGKSDRFAFVPPNLDDIMMGHKIYREEMVIKSIYMGTEEAMELLSLRRGETLTHLIEMVSVRDGSTPRHAE